MPHRSMGFLTLLPPKSKPKWFPTLSQADFHLTLNVPERAVVPEPQSLPSGPRETLR
jgi:hypothetical protein